MTNKFNWQSFISIGLLISFLVMLLSGVILYVAPEGSLSRWIGWDVFNLTKKQWEHQHSIFSLLFILFSIFHIFTINWGLLISYFALENKKLTNIKELLAAFVISILVFTGTFFSLSPFENIIELGNNISENQTIEVDRPDIPNIDKLPLIEFSEKVFNISITEMEIVLEKNNLKIVDANVSVNEFCSQNDMSPQELYLLIKKSISK
ncbi:MAG: DUF4405 domain-containing protein [Bacteroidales bacterium]|nr:DUF4405 domain-containing protein [Bacteroidales bacterium]